MGNNEQKEKYNEIGKWCVKKIKTTHSEYASLVKLSSSYYKPTAWEEIILGGKMHCHAQMECLKTNYCS